QQAALALAGHDGRAALAALDQTLVGADVEAAFLDVTAVAGDAALVEDRLDVLLVDDRVLAVELDDLDRLVALGPFLFLSQGGRGAGGRYLGTVRWVWVPRLSGTLAWTVATARTVRLGRSPGRASAGTCRTSFASFRPAGITTGSPEIPLTFGGSNSCTLNSPSKLC